MNLHLYHSNFSNSTAGDNGGVLFMDKLDYYNARIVSCHFEYNQVGKLGEDLFFRSIGQNNNDKNEQVANGHLCSQKRLDVQQVLHH